MARKFVGSDTPSTDGWVILGDELLPGADVGVVWFAHEDSPAVRVAVTVKLDGGVVGVEVHVEGNTTRCRVCQELHHRAGPPPAYAKPTPPTDYDPGVPMSTGPDELPPLTEDRVTSRYLRKVPLGDLAAVARVHLQAMADLRVKRLPDHRQVAAADAVRQAQALRGETPRPGRRGRPDRYYAQLAVAYEEWLGTGEQLESLADKFNLTSSGLRAALTVARKRDLLSPAPDGRAGGQASDRARDLLTRPRPETGTGV